MMSNFVRCRNRRVIFALTFFCLGVVARGAGNDDEPSGLLGTRYFEVGVARSQPHHFWQHANATAASINWPLFSHFDLGVAYQHTEFTPPWRIARAIDVYPTDTTPAAIPSAAGTGTPAAIDPTGESQTILLSNQPIASPPGSSANDVFTIQSQADTAGLALGWYLRRRCWAPFVKVSVARDFISYDQSLGAIHSKNRVQHDGYVISLGTEVPFRRWVFTAAFSYADLIRKPDLTNQKTSSYRFGMDANLWITRRIAGFADAVISDAKVNASYTWSYGAGIRAKM